MYALHYQGVGYSTPIIVVDVDTQQMPLTTREELNQFYQVPVEYKEVNGACWGSYFRSDYYNPVAGGTKVLVIPHGVTHSTEYRPVFGIKPIKGSTRTQEWDRHGNKLNTFGSPYYNPEAISHWFAFLKKLTGIPDTQWKIDYVEQEQTWMHLITGVPVIVQRFITSSVRMVWEYPSCVAVWYYMLKQTQLDINTLSAEDLYTIFLLSHTDVLTLGLSDGYSSPILSTVCGKDNIAYCACGTAGGHTIVCDCITLVEGTTYHKRLLSLFKGGSTWYEGSLNTTFGLHQPHAGKHINTHFLWLTEWKKLREKYNNHVA